MQHLKYVGYQIVLQEVPNEISLAFNISGCPHRCEGCHSQYLWEDSGEVLIDDFDTIINNYKEYISCVCFLGGDHNLKELKLILNKTYRYNLKTCLYSGRDDIEELADLIPFLDYLKVGRYVKELGGLSNPNTNQRMYHVTSDGNLECINSLFARVHHV